jgi:3-oxoacyl-[acyl-carrier protein] reductase
MKLSDKVAIVTGGGRGIGKAIALAFAREGADVVVAARTLPEIAQTAVEVQALGRRRLAVKADVSIWDEVNHLVEEALRAFGKIDILVNNAGIQGPISLLVENDVDEWINTIRVNLIGTFFCIKAVLPHMIERRQGKIINLSGGGAASPRPRFTAYAASKAAVVRLTETVAEEVRPFNIQVNAIAPGAVNTRMMEEVLAAGEAAGEDELDQARRRLAEGGTPPGRAAELAVFLASSESDGITGKLISAIYDDWRNWPGCVGELSCTELYTLRRLDLFTIHKLAPEWSPPSD